MNPALFIPPPGRGPYFCGEIRNGNNENRTTMKQTMPHPAASRPLPDWLFILWAGGTALLSYSLVYALRKPFTAAEFEGMQVLGMDYKVAVSIVQLLGYVSAKLLGIKYISELKPEGRLRFIVGSAALSEASLVAFGLLPAPLNIAALYFNGLSLGCMWGVLFSFLEGRRTTDLLASIMGAIKQLGFDDVIEVAKGADVTTTKEAAEFAEKVLEEGQAFMTTSCCPSYYMLAHKHIPEVAPFVSHTRSPMYYAAEIARKQYPDATIVFVGPCIAKRKEAYSDPNVDLMLSFEELGTMFVAMGIEGFSEETAVTLDDKIMPSSRGYAASEGVMSAVAGQLPPQYKERIKPIVINGIDKQAIRDLRNYAKSCPGNMVEVMACEGGCVNGCNVIANPKIATRQVKELAK